MLGGADKVTTNCFFAFDKPEALVTLMDWSVTNSDNSLLMTYGEKDTDYKLMGKSRLERLQKRVACFSAFFGAAWLYPEPTENCESPGLIAALDDVAKAAGAMRGGEFVSLPSSSMRYARPGSDLMKAWDGAKRVSAGNIAFARIRQGLNWEDLMNAAPPTDADYETMPQYDEKLKLYLKLLEDYLAGRYDPKVDMVNVPDR